MHGLHLKPNHPCLAAHRSHGQLTPDLIDILLHTLLAGPADSFPFDTLCRPCQEDARARATSPTASKIIRIPRRRVYLPRRKVSILLV